VLIMCACVCVRVCGFCARVCACACVCVSAREMVDYVCACDVCM